MDVNSLLTILCCEMRSLIRHNNGLIADREEASYKSADGVAGKEGKSTVLQGHPIMLQLATFVSQLIVQTQL